MASDDRLIPLAALQHYAFCPRQCALIHNEQVWVDNWLTAQGQLLHQKVDSGEPTTRKGIRAERSVWVNAPSLGLTGKMDLVEIDIASGCCFPVEYKRGKPKVDNWDRIQVCAQALCLEEMRNTTVDHGSLWYWQTRHREPVEINQHLRAETLAVINQVKALFASGNTPKAVYEKKCKACSLIDICNPKITSKDGSRAYVDALFEQDGSSDEEATK